MILIPTSLAWGGPPRAGCLTKATNSTAALLATVEQIKELISAILH